MNSDPLPAELLELEGRLRGRFDAGASGDLRKRVMRAVESDLAGETPSSSARSGGGWYWAAMAAAAIIVMNMSLIDSTRTEFSRRAAHGHDQMTSELQAMGQLEAQQEGILK
jgi:Tfp pilus assembly PilM family ATPase